MDGLSGQMGGVSLREDVYGTADAGLWASAPQVRAHNPASSGEAGEGRECDLPQPSFRL